MATNLTDALLSARQTSAVVRTGVVTDWNPTQVQVNVGGSLLNASFLDWYQPPIIGDLVALVRQDSSWLVLGRYAGAGTNLILNPSFEDAAPVAGVPLGWGTFTATTGGAPGLGATVSVVADTNAPQSGQAVQINPVASGAQDVMLTSSPVSVNPGETYFLSAYVTNSNFASTVGSLLTPPHHVQLVACWFSNDTETYPSASLATEDFTMVQRVLNLRKGPPYSFVSGSVQVPSTVPSNGVMRVGLRTEFISGLSLIRWDYVTARRST